MPVVVNEFEVVSEPSGQSTAAPSVVVQAPPPSANLDLDLALAERRARAQRVRAY